MQYAIQLIGNSSSTLCSFTAAEYQRTSGDMWVVGDPTKITIKTTGKYIITSNMSWATNATGIRAAYITKNGSSFSPLVESQVSAASASTTQLSVSSIVSLAAGDTIELRAYQTSGGNLNIENSRLSLSLLA